ncbi:FUSC family protein [Xanthobacter aminoxidans]|uniref:FUSC family protein n=1 Tax=Xanthobacter aminoxidans TaxID=186280 RepID=UPI002022C27C|nr:FUSC family protein [Xanthobacter aminoxidans]MCL8385271.1 FUSC family protein [Xanthobacter aminoxidans]
MSLSEPPHAASADSATLATRRLDAARHLLKPHQIRESWALAAQPWQRNAVLAGLQASLAAAIALPLALVSPWPHLVGFASLGTLAALFGRFAPQAGRGRIVLICAMWLSLAVLGMSTAAWLGAPYLLQLALLALACGLFFFVANTGQYGPPGALIFVFAAGAAMGHVASWQEVVERATATALAAGLTWLICVGTETFRQQETPEAPFPVEPVRPLDHRLVAAARITLGSAIAAFAAYAAGAAHPGWAAMGTVAVMQGTHLHISMSRAMQRMSGTVVGAGLVWLILSQEPSVWSVVALLIFLQFATEMIIGANYALGQILVTPMALLMSYLAAPGAAGTAMAPERVFDTLVGAIIGIVLAVVCSTVDDRIYLAHHHAARADRRSR